MYSVGSVGRYRPLPLLYRWCCPAPPPSTPPQHPDILSSKQKEKENLWRNILWKSKCYEHRFNMELDLQSLFVLLCTVVLIGWEPETLSLPSIWAHKRGRYWSAKIDDISLYPPGYDKKSIQKQYQFSYLTEGSHVNMKKLSVMKDQTVYLNYTVKKASQVSRPQPGCHYQTLPGRE